MSETAAGLAGKASHTAGNIAGIDLSSLKGFEIGGGGQVLGKDGNPLGWVVEGEPESLVGRTIGDNGEIQGDNGDITGRVELLPEVAQETVDQTKGAATSLADLDGLPVSDGGVIKDKAGQDIGRVVEGDAQELLGYAPNSKGEILDGDGDLVGRVELIPKALKNIADDTEGFGKPASSDVLDADKGVAQEVKPTADAAAPDLNDIKETLEGKREDTKDLVAGKLEDTQEKLENLPPLSTLEGFKCNKTGKIIGPTGKPIGELVEGDPKKLARLGVTLGGAGQFWDSHGKIIGKAQTIPPEEFGEDPLFAGLDGLHVVENGWVEDNRGKRVGRIVKGQPKKVLGRPVDEDGDVTDQYGNAIARVEYWEEPEELIPEVIDLSKLDGLTCNKLGYVIGPQGVPIARVVEGNTKELAGKKIDDGQIWDGRKAVGRVELIPDNELENKPEGPFSGLDNPVVNNNGFVEDAEGNVVGRVTEGNIKTLRGRTVAEDGDVLGKFGSVKGHAEPYEPPPEVEEDLSILEGKVVNKAGNVVDAQGNVYGRITSGDKRLAGRKVDGLGQIWGDNGKVIGKAELIPGAEEQKPEGAFFGFDNAEVGKDGVITAAGRIIGRVMEGDPQRLLGRKVDEDGDILDKNGNTIGRAERWEPEEKKRSVNPMSGRKVTREGEVRDTDGNLIGKLTFGNLGTLVGKEIDDNGYVVDNDGNKLGECTLLETLPEEEPEPGPSPEELEAQKKEEQDRQLAKKLSSIVAQTLERIHPVCKMITDHIERAERTPKEELDEEKLVQDVKPLLEEGGQILQECNGAIRALDPDGHIAAMAKARAASHEASPEEYELADQLKELTDTVLTTMDKGRRMIADMPHAKEKLNPLWTLLSEPLFQIIAAVGLLLNGVLGLVGRLLDGLGLGSLLNGLLRGLGLDNLLSNLGLTSLTDALGITGKKK